MKKTKMLVSVAAATIALLATYTTAFADIGAYTVKDAKTGVIRQYDLKSLSNSVINSMLGLGNDLLFKDFQADQTANGVNSIYDDSKKYVPFEEAKKALESSTTTGQAFDLNKYLKDAKAGETPTYVYERKVKDDKVVNGLNITKEGAELDLSKVTLEEYEDVKVLVGKVMITNGTIKGKLIVDSGAGNIVTVKNLKTDDITGISGSLKLEGVDAKNLVIEKALTLNVDTTSTLTKLVITAPKGSEVVLSGNLGTVELNSAVKLTITEGTKVDVKVTTEEAKDVTIVAEEGAEVTTDKPIENTEGPGTVTTEPETTDPGTTTGGSTGGSSGGSGGGGGDYTPPPTRTSFGNIIESILDEIDTVDNIFNSDTGYFNLNNVTWTTDSASSSYLDKVLIQIPDAAKEKTLGDIMADLRENVSTTNIDPEKFDNYEAMLTLKIFLSGKVTNEDDIKDYLDQIFTGADGGFNYDTSSGIVYNILTLLNRADTKAQILKPAGLARTYTNVPTLEINNIKIKSIYVGNTAVYTANDSYIGDISIDTFKNALGITTLATTKLKDLAGIPIKVEFINGSTREPYVFQFTTN